MRIATHVHIAVSEGKHGFELLEDDISDDRVYLYHISIF